MEGRGEKERDVLLSGLRRLQELPDSLKPTSEGTVHTLNSSQGLCMSLRVLSVLLFSINSISSLKLS